MRTLWLADHLLVSERGHHLSYNGFIADAARRAGLGVRILCARDCDVEVPRRLQDAPNFPAGLAKRSASGLLCRSRVALDILEGLARRRFRTDLLKESPLADAGCDDIILAEMLAPRNLAGWLCWLAAVPKEREPTLVLHLGYAAERFDADRESSGVAPGPEAIRKTLPLAIRDGQRRFERKVSGHSSGKRMFFVLPHVVSRRAGGSTKPPGKPVHFACLGNAREEKGFPRNSGDRRHSERHTASRPMPGLRCRAATPTPARRRRWPGSAQRERSQFLWSPGR